MYKSILVATDGTKFSSAAIAEAASLAKQLGSKLVLFYAAPHLHLSALSEGFSAPARTNERESALKEMEEEAEKILASAATNVNFEGVTVEKQFTVSESPYEAIIEAAKMFKCGLIVMGSHGRSGMSAVLLGSVAHKVLTHSSVPVLVVR
jgi:nucleotide-binding universal stress UspA family protein